MMKLYVPNGQFGAAVSVSVDGWPALTVFGVNVAVTPAGSPLMLSVAVPLKPPNGVRVTSVDVEPPGAIVSFVRLSAIVNFGAGATVRSYVAICTGMAAV